MFVMLDQVVYVSRPIDGFFQSLPAKIFQCIITLPHRNSRSKKGKSSRNTPLNSKCSIDQAGVTVTEHWSSRGHSDRALARQGSQ